MIDEARGPHPFKDEWSAQRRMSKPYPGNPVAGQPIAPDQPCFTCEVPFADHPTPPGEARGPRTEAGRALYQLWVTEESDHIRVSTAILAIEDEARAAEAEKWRHGYEKAGYVREAAVLPPDTVCACLDETGERKVRLYERCERCGAFMEADEARAAVRGTEGPTPEAIEATIDDITARYGGALDALGAEGLDVERLAEALRNIGVWPTAQTQAEKLAAEYERLGS